MSDIVLFVLFSTQRQEEITTLRWEGISWLFEMGWTIPQVVLVSAHKSWASMKIYTRLDATRGDRYAGWKWLPKWYAALALPPSKESETDGKTA